MSTFGFSLMEAYRTIYSVLRQDQTLPAEFDNYPKALKNLRQYIFLKHRKATIPQFVRMVEQFFEVAKDRATPSKDDEPAQKNRGIWGSRRQWAFGDLVSRLLTHFEVANHLHPAFAIMLCPLGGIAGPGNSSLFTGDMHNSIIIHSIVHDAFGYVGNFHKVGPSYNYLAASFFPDTSPLSCQLAGLLQSRKELKQMGMLGDKGRRSRQRDMISRRKELTSQQMDEYPPGSLPTEKEIELDYESRM